MKGQFFVVATVIMIIALMALVRYFYSFSYINLPQSKEISELDYIPYINQSMNDVVLSYNGDCNKLLTDIETNKNFIENSLIERGIDLEIVYTFNCVSPTPPDVKFDFRITSPNIQVTTEDFTPPATTCPDGSCGTFETCYDDRVACSEPPICFLRACNGGCNNPATLVIAGNQDNEGPDFLCNNAEGCDITPCECDGFGNCVERSFPPPPP